MQLKQHDWECLEDFACTTIKDLNTGLTSTWALSAYHNDLIRIYNFYRNYQGELISFNGIHYDNIISNYLVKNFKRFSSMPLQEVVRELRMVNNMIIESRDGLPEALKLYKYGHRWIDIDFLKYWSLLTIRSKKINLKGLGIHMKYPEIQNLPYVGEGPLGELSKMEEVIYYNRVNDMGLTEMLYENKKEDVELRRFIKKELGLECLSWDGVKIGSEIIAHYYQQDVGSDEFRNRRTVYKKIPLADCLLDSLDFKQAPFDMWMEGKGKKAQLMFNSHYSAIEFMKKRNVKSTTELSYSVRTNNPNGMILKSDHGSGGIHGLAFKGVFEPEPGWIIIDSDVASYYPSLILEHDFIPSHLDKIIFKNRYGWIKNTRIGYKKKGEKLWADTLKRGLNGAYGNFNNPYSWLRDMRRMLQVTINGQLILSELSNRCIETGISVLYQNTDGISVYMPKDMENTYLNIIREIENKYRLEFEHVYFSKMVVKDVNNFIMFLDGGKIKKKGVFTTHERNLEDNHNYMVVPMAILEYFSKGTDPKDFILNHRDIYDFCLNHKTDRKFQTIWNNKPQQKHNRYYVSYGCPYLYKESKETGKRSHFPELSNYGVQLFNTFVKHDDFSKYRIDYRFYLEKVKASIYELEGKSPKVSTHNQLKIF